MGRKRTRAGKRKAAAEAATPSPQVAANTTVFQQAVGFLLWLWGSNGFGQLGFGGSVMERISPTQSKFTKKIKEVAAGGMHTVVLLEDGTLWSFGVNDEGALGRDTATDDDGEPLPDRDATRPGEVTLPLETEMGGVKGITCTDSASFVVTEDGSVFGWGTFRNEHGVFGFTENVEKQFKPMKIYTPTARRSPVMKIAAGGNHVVAILKDGGALSWGDGDQGQLGRIALRNSRRRGVIKRNMLRPTKIPGCRRMVFTDVFCGEYSTFLKAANGHFFAFGLNNCGQLAISPNENLTNADTLTLEGRVENLVTLVAPTLVETFRNLNIMKVAPGKDHGLAINAAGCLYSWGVPTYGVLGRQEMADKANETTPYPVPQQVNGLEGKTIMDVASGQVISGCIDSEGDLYTWGAALNDMLGYDCDDDVMIPSKVRRTQRTEGKKFRSLHFGGQHCAMLGE